MRSVLKCRELFYLFLFMLLSTGFKRKHLHPGWNRFIERFLWWLVLELVLEYIRSSFFSFGRLFECTNTNFQRMSKCIRSSVSYNEWYLIKYSFFFIFLVASQFWWKHGTKLTRKILSILLWLFIWFKLIDYEHKLNVKRVQKDNKQKWRNEQVNTEWSVSWIPYTYCT